MKNNNKQPNKKNTDIVLLYLYSNVIKITILKFKMYIQFRCHDNSDTIISGHDYIGSNIGFANFRKI